MGSSFTLIPIPIPILILHFVIFKSHICLIPGLLKSQLYFINANSNMESSAPTPIKSIMNLTTRVTSIAFHSSGNPTSSLSLTHSFHWIVGWKERLY